MGRESVEKGDAEQSLIEQLLRSVGGRVRENVYKLGTRRRKTDYQGTMQTAGVWDVEAFLPWPPPYKGDGRQGNIIPPSGCSELLVKVESKAGKDARLSKAQRTYHEHLQRAGVACVFGDYNAVIAWLCRYGFAHPDNFPHYRQPAPVRNPQPGGRSVQP